MNLNLSTREKILLLAVGVIVIVFIGTRFLILPAVGGLRDDTVKLSGVVVQEQAARDEIAQKDQIHASLSQRLSEANSAVSAFLPSFDKPSLQIYLSRLAGGCGLTVNSVTVSDPASPTTGAAATASSAAGGIVAAGGTFEYNMKQYANVYAGSGTAKSPTSSEASSLPDAVTVNIDLGMTGTYENLKDFLDAVKATDRYISVGAVNCAKKDAHSSDYAITATLSCIATQKLSGGDAVFTWNMPAPKGKDNLM